MKKIREGARRSKRKKEEEEETRDEPQIHTVTPWERGEEKGIKPNKTKLCLISSWLPTYKS